MRLTPLIILTLTFSVVLSQEATKNDSIAIYQLYLVNSDSEAEKLANFDISHAGPFLLLQSGEASIYYSSDSLVEAKFDFSYYDFGCLSPDKNLIEAYSKVTFEYLDNKFGKQWRKEVRDDVLGLKRK